MLVLLSISTILACAGHQHLHAQQVTNQTPPTQTQDLPSAPTPQLDLSNVPHAVPLPGKAPDRAILESDTQSKHGDIYLLAGDVVITYRDRILRADTIRYNAETGDTELEGHVRVTGGENDEHIEATHGLYNVRTQTGRFDNVTGSVGLSRTTTNEATRKPGFQSNNPFLFSGRVVIKTGPDNYDVYDGWVTSCLLPTPDWQLFARHFTIDGQQAKASKAVFRLLGIPLLPLPYVTHPTNTDGRQSGFLIPVLSYSNSKGFVIGEQIYYTLGRSADVTLGSTYYSIRGFAESGTFRFRGAGNDFLNAHFSALQDRGYTPAGGVFTNQGGEDVTLGFRKDFTPNTRVIGDGEYLSSYIYREAFTENFNQAVSSDITSIGYLTRQNNGYTVDGRFDRYQGLKRVSFTNSHYVTIPEEQIRIFHAPSIDVMADDHRIAGTPLLWSLDASAAGLKRVQPNFVSSGIIERLDVRPELSLPLSGAGWSTMSSLAVRETFYTRSRADNYQRNPGAAPVELTQPVNRFDIDANIVIRPPVIERTFLVPTRWQKLFGKEVRHTIEPEFTYHDVSGINNFLSILRFDDEDLASNTNELEYGVTQHLFFRPVPRPGKAFVPTARCPVEVPTELDAANDTTAVDPVQQASNDANGIPNISSTAPDLPTRTHARHADPCATPAPKPAQQEWFSWRLTQRHFFDQSFGNAVLNGRRNIFDSTLSLSGVAFLTEPRDISPLISRMRMRTSSHTDLEWDFDYDTGASKFNSSNIFIDAHEGNLFGGFSFARLNAPGRFYTEVIDSTTNTDSLVSSPVSAFTQTRFLLGYGMPSRSGLSVAGNAGIDIDAGNLQYLSIQANYNWNCCGLSVEYRKYELGSVRNEGVERFNFTLANIGSAGNLRRAESLF